MEPNVSRGTAGVMWVGSGLVLGEGLAFLGLFFGGRLGGHVDGSSRHGDGAAARDQVQLHSLAGDVGGRHLHLLGQPQVGAKA